MSQTDSFIDEVTEEVRRERFYTLLRRYGWIAVLLLILVIGGAAFNEWRKAREQTRAQELGDAVVAALQGGEPGSRAVALGEIEAEGTAAALIAILRAGELGEADPDAAAAILEGLRAQPDLAPLYRDVASLKLAMIEEAPLYSEDRLALLDPLTAPGAPLRLLALEQMALLHLERDETDAARDRLQLVRNDAETSPAQRQRVRELLIVLGGKPEGA